ncbi:Hsp70 family protein [Pseudooceanicola sp. MF1-13]|uniref:Hsp70 family protein n=1 Tax=Pseudooceanicola sp. MF1-13 TaxID=3379095 RepID=UPI0038922344
MPRLAVDFGTSNSAVAYMDGGAVRRVLLEHGEDTLPTAVFFPVGGAMQIGRAAGQALIDGVEGRYMRALKSVLGTPLFHESRLMGGRRQTLADVVTAFLKRLRDMAQDQSGLSFDAVLSGRPVRFHHDPVRDQQAEDDLRACYVAAGFTTVDFLFEPEAAALSSVGNSGDLGLIVDIGGGTSDFTVFRRGANGVEVIASHGIRLGGTDFDRALSLTTAMPELGKGTELRREMGEGRLPVPQAIYTDLATWSAIPFLYTRETERMVEDLVKFAVERPKLERLQRVIRDHLGHDVAFAVEAGKIAVNGDGPAQIDLSVVERDLSLRLTKGGLNAALAEFTDPLKMTIYETLQAAQVSPMQIGSVVLVGGSSLMRLVQDTAQEVCPTAQLSRSEAFTGVVDGLALAAG